MYDHCRCRHCGSDLFAGFIPEHELEAYGAGLTCKYGGGKRPHFSRMLGIYDINQDRTVAWRCPDCWYDEPRE